MLRRPDLLIAFSTAMAVALACDRRDSARVDSAADTTAVDTTANRTDAAWVGELGSLLAIPADSDDAGVILFPSNPTQGIVTAQPVTLLTSSGASSSVRAALVESDSQVCGEAPTLRLVTPHSGAWSVALAGTTLAAVAMDSIESLSPADSARLTTTMARLASTVPHTAERFKALPFVVLTARTYALRERQVVIAHLRRRLPQEATPLEEHTLLVAERPAAGDDPFVVSYSQRSEGTEETADHYDVLAVLSGRESTYLILARDQDERSTYDVVQRTRTGVWRTRWTRTLAC